jgi:hypothetical protein
MLLSGLYAKLAGIEEPEGTVVTLSLDVSRSGTLPPATRVFLKDQVARYLGSEARSPQARRVLRGVAGRIGKFVEEELRPEAESLFLVAGETAWEPVELQVPLANFIITGRTAYLAPLLEAAARAPRAYVLRATGQEGTIHDVSLGRWSQAGQVRCRALELVDKDAERLVSGRRGSRPGGSRKDRYDHMVHEAAGEMISDAARRIGALHGRAPADAVFVFGDPEFFDVFVDHLPASIRDRARHLGLASARDGQAMKESVSAEIARAARERQEAEILELHERWAQGKRVALGPADVLAALDTGKVARAFVDPQDPLPGMKCGSCGKAYPGLKARCDACEEDLFAASMTQEVVARSVTHPPLGLTFVSPPAPWLKSMGGMAALLSEKGFRTRRRT